MKKLISFCLTVLLVLSFTACDSTSDPNNTPSEEENVCLSVLGINTDYSRNFIQVIQAHFPDVKLQVEYYAAPNNGSGYVDRLLESGNGPDIVYSGALLKEELQKKYLLDLSSYDFAGQYSVSIMNQRDIDGALYMLPGTYSVFSMLYNKSLFEEKGWTVPTTNDEFTALCRQIREETDIIPVTHCGFAVGTYWRMLGALAQSGFLSTSEGAEWTKAFREGKVSFETGFGDALRMMQGWKDAGVLDASDGTSSINDSYAKLMNREAAMAYTVGGLASLSKAIADCEDKIGAFPFLGEDRDSGLLTTSMNFNFGLSKALGESGNEQKLAKALDIMAFLSSEEGQKELAVLDTDVSPLGKKTPPAENTPYADVWELVEGGDCLPYLMTDYYDIWVQCGSELKEAILGNGSLESIARDMDELHQKALTDQDLVQPLATVEEDMTHPQTVQVMADLLYEMGADVAVVSDGTFIGNVANTTGVSGRLFAGDIYQESSYNINIPGALNKSIMRLTLTGRELFALLEGGHSVTEGSETAVFDYYWSGMDAEMKDGRIVSAVLRNGTPVEESGTYRVLICKGDYAPAVYQSGEDTGIIVSDAYLNVMEGKTLTAPGKLCR
ncbi:extracellular solute-binding protein [Roseburia hominis]